MNTATRRLTVRQLAKALAEIDAQLETLRQIEQAYSDGFAHCSPVPEMVYDAWNATHGAIRSLEERRDRVELNPRPIPAAEYDTWLLVQQNID